MSPVYAKNAVRIVVISEEYIYTEWLLFGFKQKDRFEVCGERDAASGINLLTEIKKQEKRVDLVIIDVETWVGPSYLLAMDEIRKLWPACKFLILTSSETAQSKPGVSALLQKPIRGSNLIETAKALLFSEIRI